MSCKYVKYPVVISGVVQRSRWRWNQTVKMAPDIRSTATGTHPKTRVNNHLEQSSWGHPSWRRCRRSSENHDVRELDMKTSSTRSFAGWLYDAWHCKITTENSPLPHYLPSYFHPSPAVNWFQTAQGQCSANLHKWRSASSDKYSYPQMMKHIVESCPLTKLADDGLQQLHFDDDNAITCLWTPEHDINTAPTFVHCYMLTFIDLLLNNLGRVSSGPTICHIMLTYWPVNKNI